jgi:hypothetical protein
VTSDQKHDERSPGEIIQHLFSLLEKSTAPAEYADLCSQLVMLARDMTDAELLALATAVQCGPEKRGRGAPKKARRLHQIDLSLRWNPKKADGTPNIGLGGPSRVERITAIAARHKMGLDAARKAYDQAMKPFKDAKKARKVVADKKGK